jgi:hypothetical protein
MESEQRCNPGMVPERQALPGGFLYQQTKRLECSPELIIPELVPLEENPICDLAEGIEIHEPDPILLEPDHVEGVAG